jgi:hypothetical protein
LLCVSRWQTQTSWFQFRLIWFNQIQFRLVFVIYK